MKCNILSGLLVLLLLRVFVVYCCWFFFFTSCLFFCSYGHLKGVKAQNEILPRY